MRAGMCRFYTEAHPARTARKLADEGAILRNSFRTPPRLSALVGDRSVPRGDPTSMDRPREERGEAAAHDRKNPTGSPKMSKSRRVYAIREPQGKGRSPMRPVKGSCLIPHRPVPASHGG